MIRHLGGILSVAHAELCTIRVVKYQRAPAGLRIHNQSLAELHADSSGSTVSGPCLILKLEHKEIVSWMFWEILGTGCVRTRGLRGASSATNCKQRTNSRTKLGKFSDLAVRLLLLGLEAYPCENSS
jgi:hypothetical protein